VRYNPDGNLDTTFGIDGMVTTDFGQADLGQAVIIQPDGRIASGWIHRYGGSRDFALAVYHQDGSLDNSFGNGGKVITNFGGSSTGLDVGIQSDGKLVMGGYANITENADFALARYNLDGSLDDTFGSGGKVITDLSYSSNDTVKLSQSRLITSSLFQEQW